jgi:hypothetical protein
MRQLLEEEILGALDDLGTEVILDSGARITVPFRRDYREADFPDARIDSEHTTLVVSESQVATHQIRKGTGLTVNGDRFIVHKPEPLMTGFVRLILTDQ